MKTVRVAQEILMVVCFGIFLLCLAIAAKGDVTALAPAGLNACGALLLWKALHGS